MLGPFLWGKSDINQAYPLRLDLPIAAAPSVFSSGRPFPMLIACKRARSANPMGNEQSGGFSEIFQIGVCYKGGHSTRGPFQISEIGRFQRMLIASVSSIALYSYMPPCNVQ